MDPITQQTVLAAAGAAGGDPVYVDDVFSTFVYTGNGTARSINNGIDLAGEGGLVWIKNRDNGYQDHVLNDTERGAGQTLRSDSANAQFLSTARFSAFNSNGFSVGTDTGTNNNNEDIVSWTFRKAPGFFDIVTYTGNGTNQNISHSLGSVPGMIIIKSISANSGYNWRVYHRSLGKDYYGVLNATNAFSAESGTGYIVWNNTEPTSSVFSVGSAGTVNANGVTYIAYIFAHDDASFGTGGNESITKCGSYTGNSGSQAIDLGFEPQWVMVKNTSASADWVIFDVMRNVGSKSSSTTSSPDQSYLKPNTTDAETTDLRFYVNNTGFELVSETQSKVNYSGNNYIYMAIRRPHKPPEAATEVFAIDTGNSSSTIPAFDSGFPVDFAFRLSAYASGGNNPRTHSRLQGAKELYTSASAAEAADSPTVFDSMTGMSTGFNSNDIAWMFKRAPGFFDVVAYTADGTTGQQKNHNLTVTPELMLVKIRSGNDNWSVYHKDLGATKYLKLNTTSAAVTAAGNWQNTAPTSTQFTVGGDAMVGANTHSYIAYLFATLPGISKVGSYTGTGSALNIDCGFTSGARFVLIKRTDNGGNWFVLDTVRGIVSGNDPLLELNSTSAQDSSYDNLDPYNQGFTVTAYGGTSPYLNISGGTYLFLAIA